MAQVLIRDLDESVIARLKARAAGRGVSMQSYLRSIVVRAVGQDDPAEWLDRVSKLQALVKPGDPTVADLIREDRDNR